MTFSAFGFAEGLPSESAWRDALIALSGRDGLRVVSATRESLHTVPDAYVPADDAYLFELDEGRGGVEYLLDSLDYAPDADIGLPTKAADRLALLVDLVGEIVSTPGLRRVGIALTDCDEIERVRTVAVTELARAIREDWAEISPSNVLYVTEPDTRGTENESS